MQLNLVNFDKLIRLLFNNYICVFRILLENIDSVQRLIRNQNLNIENRYGESPLSAAADKGCLIHFLENKFLILRYIEQLFTEKLSLCLHLQVTNES